MDPLTQGLLGAVVSQSSVKKNTSRQLMKVAVVCGILGGMAPDLDVLIRSSEDSLLGIEYHRHFTHSLAFIPIGGMITAFVLWYFLFKKSASFKQVAIFTTLGYATHGLLDACTSYGTQLFVPFSNYRVSWNVVSIIDPVYTLTLLIFLVIGYWRKSVNFTRAGFLLSLCYLGFGYFQQQQAVKQVELTAEKRGHKIERIFMNPTIANNILWRGVYQYQNKYYVDAVYVPIWAEHKLYEGTSVDVIDIKTVFPFIAADSVQRRDIHRFSYFSKDFIYKHPDYDNVIADLRYGTLPYDDKSLWGLQVDENNQHKHAVFITLRNYKDSHYNKFKQMIKGSF
jgi:inner membrane protein